MDCRDVYKPFRYTKTHYRLDEQDGWLCYAGQPITPVSEVMAEHQRHLNRHLPEERWKDPDRVSVLIGWPERTKFQAAIGDETAHLYAICQCRHCGSWAIGSGTNWCSDTCRLAGRADDARKQRAAAHVPLPPVACVVCGTTIEATRKTRRYCSDRCRQQAHRLGPTA